MDCINEYHKQTILPARILHEDGSPDVIAPSWRQMDLKIGLKKVRVRSALNIKGWRYDVCQYLVINNNMTKLYCQHIFGQKLKIYKIFHYCLKYIEQ